MQIYKVIFLIIPVIILFIYFPDRSYSSDERLALGFAEIGVLNFKDLSSMEDGELGLSFSFFLSEALSFIKNISVVPNDVIQVILSREVSYNSSTLSRIAKSLKVSYLIYGYYNIEGRVINVNLNVFNASDGRVLNDLALEGRLDNFSNLLERLVIEIAGLFKFTKEVSFEREALRSYILLGAKDLSYLDLFADAYNSFISGDLSNAIQQARKLELVLPRDLHILFLLADSYFILGNLSVSLSYYRVLFNICKAKKLRFYFSKAALGVARVYNKQGNYTAAISLLQRILDLSVSQNDLLMRSRVLRELGNLYFLKGEYSVANTYYYDALRNDRLRGDIIEEAKTLFLIGEFFYNKGEYAKAFREIKRVIAIHKSKYRKKSLVRDYILLSSIVSSFGDLRESLKICEYAERLSVSFSFLLLRSDVLLKKAIIMELMGRLGLAEGYVRESLSLRGDNKHLASSSYSILGLIYYNKGNFKKSLSFYKKSLQLNKSIGFRRSIARDYSNIGKLYVKFKDYKRAIFYYNEALLLRKFLGDKLGVAITNNSFANIYIERDRDYDKALTIYLASVAMMDDISYREGVALSYWMVGNIYSSRGNYKEALSYYFRCKDIFTLLGNPNYKNIEVLIGDLYRRLEEREEREEREEEVQ